MSAAAPQTKTNDLFDQLAVLMKYGEQHDPLAVRRIERDAIAFKKSEPEQTYQVLAAIASLRWQFDTALAYAERAMELGGGPKAAFNNAVTFCFMNRPDVANRFVVNSITSSGPILKTTVKAITTCLALGQLEAACHLYSRGKAANLDLDKVLSADPIELKESANSLGISEARIATEVQAALDVLTERKLRHSSLFADSDHDEEGRLESLVIEIGYFGPQPCTTELEEALAHKLMEMPEWDPRVLAVEYCYLEAEPHDD